MSADERKNEAIHESAHATAAWAEGIGIKRVTLEGPVTEEELKKGKATPYYCQLMASSLEAFRELSDDVFFSRILVKLAPWAVEEKLNGELSALYSMDVLDSIDFLAWPVHRNSRIQDCVESAKRAIAEHPDDRQKQALQFYEDQKSHIMELLNPQIMSGVESLANLLVKRGSLTGFEVALHLEEVLAESLPGKALPAEEHYCPPAPYSPELAIESSRKLCKMAFEILHAADRTGEDKRLEEARKAVMHSIFRLAEISAGGDSPSRVASGSAPHNPGGETPRG